MQLHRLKFTKEEVEAFANYYNAGHSIKETASYFEIGYREMLHYLIYFGHYIPRRKNRFVENLCENPRFFSEIDTKDKAYFLGLLMSDGYILTSLYNKEVGIALQSEDRYILDKLNNYVSPRKALSKYKNSYKWKVVSTEMYEDLKQYGITENKSHSEYTYPKIPKEFDRDFIRGYFDGNGCITIKATGYNVISFCSNSIEFLKSLASTLLSYGIQTRPIYSTNRNRTSMFHTLYLSGGINKSIFKKFLYEDAETYLIRKYVKFKEIPC
jgi:intein/homing endonuclease